MTDMEEYLEFAKALARRAGAIMTDNFKPGIEREIKADNTPVTVADTAINKLVIDEVGDRFPGHSVLGEEDSSELTETEHVWVCDPIDGTIPFTLGIPTSTFSIALVHKGETVLGIIYDPYTDRLFEAIKGGKALLNGQPISVNTEVAPNGFVTMPAMQYGLTDPARMIAAAMSQGIRSFSLCSITYEAMLVASGQTTGAIFPGKTPWDIAAVKIIVEAAGGQVTDLFGNNQRYDRPIKGAVISNGQMHDELVALASKFVI